LIGIRIVLWLLLCALGVFVVRSFPAINDVRTGGTPEYPDLQPRRYRLPRERVWEAALATARSRRGWEIIAADQSRIRAVADVLLTPFKDEVAISVTEENGHSLVNVRSYSRVGRTDLGVNARRIRGYLRALDARLNQVKD
jgi:uncharacterized protein (DUF1499 family)